MNFQIFKLDLEKAEEPEIKLPTFAGSSKKKRVLEKHLLLPYWLRQRLWLCGSQQTVENSETDGIPDHLTHLLRNLDAVQEVTVRTGHGTTDWFQISKGVHQGSILSLCSLNLHAEYIRQNAGLDEALAGIKIVGRNINNISPLDCKEIQPVNPKGNQSWIFTGRTDGSGNSKTLATWCKELTLWKRPWCWERLKVGGEGDRGWDVGWHHWLDGHEFE